MSITILRATNGLTALVRIMVSRTQLGRGIATVALVVRTVSGAGPSVV